MATQCIDVMSDKRSTDGSLISFLVFAIIFFVQNLLMNFGLIYIFVAFFTWGISTFVFSYSPRMVILACKNMFFTEPRKSPNFENPHYIYNENLIPEVVRFKGDGPESKDKIFSSLPS